MTIRRLEDRRLVVLPRAIFDRCLAFGAKIVRHYKAGGSPQSLALSGGRGTELNVKRQTQGKMRLQSEGAASSKSSAAAMRARLRNSGATPEDCEFLVHRRVELNAMTRRFAGMRPSKKCGQMPTTMTTGKRKTWAIDTDCNSEVC